MRTGAKILAVLTCLLFLAGPLMAMVPAGAETQSRIPVGETTERIVVGELFTGTWCGFCRYAEQAMDAILDDPAYFDSRFILIEWHIGDDYQCSDGPARKNYYNVGGYPNAQFDGGNEVSGAGSNASAQTAYKQKIDARPTTANAFLDIDAVLKNNDSQLQVWVNATLLKDTTKKNLKLHAVLVEDEDFWDGEYPIRMTARDHVINTATDISEKGETARGTATVNINPSWIIEDLYLIAFLQSDDDKSIFNGVLNGPGPAFSVDSGPEVQGTPPAVSMDEDTQDSTINMAGLFSDPDSDPIVYYGVIGSEHIAAVKDPSHKVTLTPETDWTGTETIKLIAADEDNCPTEIDVQVTVNPVNDPPFKVGALPSVTLVEGQTKDAFNLYDYFDDIDNLELTFTSTGSDQVTVTVKASGLVTLKAPTGLVGGEEINELITFKGTDSGGLFVEDNSLVTVSDVNQPPVMDLAVGNVGMAEDTVDKSIKLVDHFSDPDDTLSFEITGQLHINVDIGADSVVTLTPEADWNGEEHLTVTATDGTNPVVSDDFYVTVTPVNDAPILSGGVFETVEFNEDDDYTTTATVDKLFKDIDTEDKLSYTIDGGDENLEITLNQDLTVSFEPERNWYGKMDYIIKASDGNEIVTYTASVEVLSVNDPVVIESYGPLATSIDIRENDNVDFNVVATDEDGTEPNYIWSVNEEAVSTAGSTYTFDTDYTSSGTYVIKAKVTDGETNELVTWTVKVRDLNRDPSVTIVSPAHGDEFELTDTISFKAEASDPDNDDLTVKWLVDNRPLGSEFEFTKALTAGEHTLRVTVTDGKGGIAEETININVKGKETTTGGASGSGLSGVMVGGLLAVVIIVVLVIVLVAMRSRKPKGGAPEDFPPPPPPPIDALAPLPPPPDAQYDPNYGGYDGYTEPPPPPPYGYEQQPPNY